MIYSKSVKLIDKFNKPQEDAPHINRESFEGECKLPYLEEEAPYLKKIKSSKTIEVPKPSKLKVN